MSYQPKSEETLIKEGLFLDGEYDFEVVDTDDKPSKAGNDMFTLKQTFFGNDGRTQYVTTYIALGSNYGERMLRHAADACGILNIYESGKLTASDFKGRSGKAWLKTDPGDGSFMPKNAVKEYSKRLGQPETPKPMAKEVMEDAVPF